MLFRWTISFLLPLNIFRSSKYSGDRAETHSVKSKAAKLLQSRVSLESEASLLISLHGVKLRRRLLENGD
jgi:hypothetical protein